MKSKKLPDGNYLIVRKYDKFPYKINGQKLHMIMGNLAKKIIELRGCIDFLSEEEPEILAIIKEYSYNFNNFVDNLRKLGYILDELEDFADFLEEDDDVKPIEDLWDLSDEGFTLSHFGASKDESEYMWEKVLSSADDKDVVEEIYVINDKVLHRKRTIIYDISEPGIKSSTSIYYEDLPLTPKLMKTIGNSINAKKI